MADMFATMPSIPIPLHYLLIGGIIVFVVILGLIFYLLSVYKFGKEGFMFAKARRKGIPVLCVVDVGSNQAKYELGTKKKKDDIEYDNDLSGIQVDPSLTTGGVIPTRFEKGLNIYTFSTIDWLPITNANALAYQTLSKWKNDRKEYDFLTFQEFTTLISTPKHHLLHDVKNYISTKKPTYQYTEEGKLYEAELEAEDMIKLVDTARVAVAKLPIIPGFMTYNQAFEAIPQAYAAQDLELLKTLIRKQIEQEWLKKINVMMYAIAALIVMIGGAIAMFIIGRMGGGG
jgi:hypothetical protein